MLLRTKNSFHNEYMVALCWWTMTHAGNCLVSEAVSTCHHLKHFETQIDTKSKKIHLNQCYICIGICSFKVMYLAWVNELDSVLADQYRTDNTVKGTASMVTQSLWLLLYSHIIPATKEDFPYVLCHTIYGVSVTSCTGFLLYLML